MGRMDAQTPQGRKEADRGLAGKTDVEAMSACDLKSVARAFLFRNEIHSPKRSGRASAQYGVRRLVAAFLSSNLSLDPNRAERLGLPLSNNIGRHTSSFASRCTRLCPPDKSGGRQKRRQVAALQKLPATESVDQKP
jgi:hypothetical protein